MLIYDMVYFTEQLDGHVINIFIRFGARLYRHIVDVLMGTNCASIVAGLFVFLFVFFFVFFFVVVFFYVFVMRGISCYLFLAKPS